MNKIVLFVLVLAAFASAKTFVQPKPTGRLCGLCQNGAALVKDYLTKTDDELLAMMYRLCSKIPAQLQPQCKAGVSTMGKQTLVYMRKAFNDQPRQVCENFGFCATTGLNLNKMTHAEVARKVNAMIYNKECNLDELREFFYWAPPTLQREIKRQLNEQFLGQFPRLRPAVVEKLVNDMFDMKVPAQNVCDDIERIIIPEARRRQMCQEECLAKVDLSIVRIYNVVMKCRLELRCYMQEVAEEMQNVAKCAHECYMAPDKKMVLY